MRQHKTKLISRRLVLGACVTSVSLASVGLAVEGPAEDASNIWPGWRGPGGDGVTSSDVPVKWSESENVLWRSPLPGRGHGSPTVVGDQVLLATAESDTQRQSVISFDLATGKTRWQAIVHEGGFENKSSRTPNEKASLASSTVASDGERLYINFLNENAIWTSALSLDGQILWQKRISDYVLHQGYGSSPIVRGDHVIASADNKGGGVVVALDRKTGDVVWQHARPAKPNYSSPVLVCIDGKDQLIMTGCDLVESLDPNSGAILWSVEGATTECVTSTVTDGRLVFSSGGFPRNHIAAYAADEGGKVVWENRMRLYVPSMVYDDGYLYFTLDEGIAVCLRCSDGKAQWRERLGGTFSASPVLVGDQIYATNEDGETFIFKADPKSYQQVAKNKLGTSVFASPAVAGNNLLMRVARYQDGERRESLVCIGKD